MIAHDAGRSETSLHAPKVAPCACTDQVSASHQEPNHTAGADDKNNGYAGPANAHVFGRTKPTMNVHKVRKSATPLLEPPVAPANIADVDLSLAVRSFSPIQHSIADIPNIPVYNRVKGKIQRFGKNRVVSMPVFSSAEMAAGRTSQGKSLPPSPKVAGSLPVRISSAAAPSTAGGASVQRLPRRPPPNLHPKELESRASFQDRGQKGEDGTQQREDGLQREDDFQESKMSQLFRHDVHARATPLPIHETPTRAAPPRINEIQPHAEVLAAPHDTHTRAPVQLAAPPQPQEQLAAPFRMHEVQPRAQPVAPQVYEAQLHAHEQLALAAPFRTIPGKPAPLLPESQLNNSLPVQRCDLPALPHSPLVSQTFSQSVGLDFTYESILRNYMSDMPLGSILSTTGSPSGALSAALDTFNDVESVYSDDTDVSNSSGHDSLFDGDMDMQPPPVPSKLQTRRRVVSEMTPLVYSKHNTNLDFCLDLGAEYDKSRFMIPKTEMLRRKDGNRKAAVDINKSLPPRPPKHFAATGHVHFGHDVAYAKPAVQPQNEQTREQPTGSATEMPSHGRPTSSYIPSTQPSASHSTDTLRNGRPTSSYDRPTSSRPVPTASHFESSRPVSAASHIESNRPVSTASHIESSSGSYRPSVYALHQVHRVGAEGGGESREVHSRAAKVKSSSGTIYRVRNIRA